MDRSGVSMRYPYASFQLPWGTGIAVDHAGDGIGRPFIAPPGMPADRVKMLHDAFTATMRDPDFLADAKKQKLDVAPMDGEHLAALVKRIYTTPKPIVDKVTELIK